MRVKVEYVRGDWDKKTLDPKDGDEFRSLGLRAQCPLH